MSRFDERIATGLARVTSEAGVLVTLRRGAQETALVPAVVGNSQMRNADAESVQVEQSHRDYLIDASAYVIEGFSVEPRAGDEIDQTIDATVRRFEVQPLTGTDTPWSWSDGNRTRYRIHTREIDARE